MAYFSNGYEGDRFEARYCERCAHCPEPDPEVDVVTALISELPEPCPVWALHEMWNGEQTRDPGKRHILEMFIRPNLDGEQYCRMFALREAPEPSPATLALRELRPSLRDEVAA